MSYAIVERHVRVAPSPSKRTLGVCGEPRAAEHCEAEKLRQLGHWDASNPIGHDRVRLSMAKRSSWRPVLVAWCPVTMPTSASHRIWNGVFVCAICPICGAFSLQLFRHSPPPLFPTLHCVALLALFSGGGLSCAFRGLLFGFCAAPVARQIEMFAGLATSCTPPFICVCSRSLTPCNWKCFLFYLLCVWVWVGMCVLLKDFKIVLQLQHNIGNKCILFARSHGWLIFTSATWHLPATRHAHRAAHLPRSLYRAAFAFSNYCESLTLALPSSTVQCPQFHR